MIIFYDKTQIEINNVVEINDLEQKTNGIKKENAQ